LKTLALVLTVAALAACSDRQPDAAAPATDAPATGAAADANDPSSAAPPAPVPGDGPDSGSASAQASMDTAPVQDDYLGRWTGVEGMYLEVAAKPEGGVTLDMQWDLDNRGTFDGSVTAEGLRFMRNGVAETAVPSDGDATGLKYLAGKQDCLTVKPGEGYCRD
jgi:hypothetical protein